jgi:plasmid stability protein
MIPGRPSQGETTVVWSLISEFSLPALARLCEKKSREARNDLWVPRALPGCYGKPAAPPFLSKTVRLIALEVVMPQLLVRNIEPDVVAALKDRAARHGRSAEAEHRKILREALRSECVGVVLDSAQRTGPAARDRWTPRGEGFGLRFHLVIPALRATRGPRQVAAPACPMPQPTD